MARLLPLNTGDTVEVLFPDGPLPGEVVMASPNYKSLAINCDGLGVAVLWDDHDEYRNIFSGKIIRLSLPN